MDAPLSAKTRSIVNPLSCAKAVTAGGALAAIAEALRVHRSHPGVLHWGTTALLRLTSGSEERTRLAVEAGAFDALEGATKRVGDKLRTRPNVAAKVMLAHTWLSHAAGERSHEVVAGDDAAPPASGKAANAGKAEQVWMQLVRERAAWAATDSAYLGENAPGRETLRNVID